MKPNFATRSAIFLVHLYQLTLSRFLGGRCRFEPSCSNYALGAFKVFGFWKGLFLSSIRLLKCQPFHPGGYNPVPSLRKSHSHDYSGRFSD